MSEMNPGALMLSSRTLCLLLASELLLFSSELSAVDQTWRNTANGSILLPSNWSPSSQVPNGIATFPAGGGNRPNLSLNGTWSIQQITLSGGVVSPFYALSVSNSSTLNVGNIVTGGSQGISNSQGANFPINNSGTINITGGSASSGTNTVTYTLNSGSSLNFSGSSQTGTNSSFTINSGSTLSFSGSSQISSGRPALSTTGGTIRFTGSTSPAPKTNNVGLQATANGNIEFIGNGSVPGSPSLGSSSVLATGSVVRFRNIPGDITTTSGITLTVNNSVVRVDNTLTSSSYETWASLGGSSGSSFQLNSMPGFTLQFNSQITGTSNQLQINANDPFETYSGTVILTRDNNFTNGSTTIFQGALQVGNGGVTGALGTGNISNSGLLVYNRSNSITEQNSISGPGSLVQTGSGTLILTGTNTYTGTTTISSGTLQVGNGGVSGTLGTGAVTNSGTLVFNRSNALTISNGISGTGALTKNGSDVLTLSGSNSYSGLTTVSAGTLAAGASNTFSSSSRVVLANSSGVILDLSNGSNTIANLSGGGTTGGTVQLGANTLTLGGDNQSQSFSGAIIGTGSVVKVGTGTFTLGGTNNTYSGGTTVSAGTLQGSAESLQGDIINNAAVVFNQTSAGTYAGVMSGSGSLTKQNSGTLTLSGANSYSGGTTVTGGTLQGDTSSVQGNITNNGSVVFDQASPGTYAGVMSGTGSLTKQNSDTLILTGANTYTGTTAISSGTLQIGDGGTSGTLGTGAVTNDGTLSFNRSNALTISNEISGTGALTKNGSDVLTLSGSNSYSGLTTVSAGTLAAGAVDTFSPSSHVVLANSSEVILDLSNGNNTIANLSGGGTTGGTVQLGANVLTLGGDNLSQSFNGAIIGSGSIVKVGTGTFTLGGTNNTYSGGTTVSAGTLQGSAESLQGDIINNAAVVFDQTSPGTYAGVMSGTGSLTKQSAGTLTLSGANSYSGGTTVSEGTLQGDTLSVQGNITNDGSVVFDQASTGTYAGVMSGTGALTKQSSGTLILTGTNTYTGTTAISSGTLQIGDGGANGTLGTGAVTNDGTLSFNRTDVITIPNQISGSGAVEQIGTGKLTLTGTNSYAGGVYLTAGSVEGSTASLIGNIHNHDGGALPDCEVIFNQTVDGTYSGVISGSGKVTKEGSGRLTMTGASSYTGLTTVNNGTLSINGSIASPVNVEQNGTLRGSGSIGGVAIINGTARPGNSIGTLTFENGLVFKPGSTVEVEIHYGGASSLFQVTGEVSIDHSDPDNLPELFVFPEPPPGLYLSGSEWTIINSNTSVDGQFKYTAPEMLPTLFAEYGIKQVKLHLPVTTLVGVPLNGLSGDNLILAKYFNSLITDPNIQNVVSNFYLLPLGLIDQALNSINPIRLKTEVFTSLNTQFAVTSSIESRLQERRRTHFSLAENQLASTWRKRGVNDRAFTAASKGVYTGGKTDSFVAEEGAIWINGFGQFSHEKSQSSTPAFDVTATACFLGYDRRFSGVYDALCGGGVGYAHNTIKMAYKMGESDSNLYSAALYGGLYGKDFYVDVSLLGTYDQVENQRHIVYPGTDTYAKSNPHSWILTPHLDFGRDFTYGWLTIEPFASFDWAVNWAKKIIENGATTINMEVNAQRSSMLKSEGGINLYEEWEADGNLLYARQTVSYINKNPFSVGKLTGSFVGYPGSITLEAFTELQNLVAPAFELFYQDRSGTYFSFAYQGEFGSGYRSNEVRGAMGISF
jgi:autotransporter-associated beta strand protein